MHDRLEGCLKLGAVGDALGYCVEFDRADAIVLEHGQRGIRLAYLLEMEKPVVSDDTQMTLFTAEGAVGAWTAAGGAASHDDVIRGVSAAYLRWYGTQAGHPDAPSGIAALEVMNARRAPGSTCLKGCMDGASGTPARPLNSGDGCGGVMRVAPLAFLPGVTPEKALVLGARAAALTHGHPSAWQSAGMLTYIICALGAGADLEKAAFAAARKVGAYGAEGVVSLTRLALDLHRDGGPPSPSVVEHIGGGWNGREALAIAIYAALASGQDPERCLEIASFHSGDSDSTASIAGQIVGAALGWESARQGLPGACYARLDARQVIDDVIVGMSALHEMPCTPSSV